MADEDEKEQQLREKIAAQEMAMAQLPSLGSIAQITGPYSPEAKERAQQIKELLESEKELELLLESRRVAAVIRLQDELHPPVNSEDCPICLETIKHVNSFTISRFDCCGGWMCSKCRSERDSNAKNGRGDAMFQNKCPFCRQTFFREGEGHKTIGKKMLEHSNKGKAWASYKIAFWHLSEEGRKFGFSFNKEKGLQLLKQAVDQRDSDALMEMVKVYSGDYGIFEHDHSKCMYYAKEAADLGNPEAQQALAFAYRSRQQEDKEQHLHYMTLAASQGSSKAWAMLGQYFKIGECGLTKSMILALHYIEKSLGDTTNGESEIFRYAESLFKYSLASYEHIHNRYEGIVYIPGHSPIPKLLYSARKAMEEGPDTPEKRDLLMRTISGYEYAGKRLCANCWKFSESGSSFKRCVRCSGAWYCGKQCQVAHWKAGHKIDCIKKN